MKDRVRLGCIGAGSRGQYLLEAAKLLPGVDIVAACDPDTESLTACGERFGISPQHLHTSADALLRDGVDAVIVATHIAKHTEMAVKALAANVHVLSEIPTIGSIDDAKALLAAADKHPDVIYMTGENCCYWHFIREWKKLYSSGELGQAVFCESDYIHPWHTMERPDGNMTWRSYMPSIHYVTHNLGPLLFIMDDMPAAVSGFFPDFNHLEARHPVPADGVAMIKTAKGAMIKIYIGFGCTHRGGHNFVIYGSKGSLENGRLGKMEDRHTYACLPGNADPYEETVIPIGLAAPGASDFGHGGADVMMIAEFISAIREKRRPELGVEFGIYASLPGLLAEESAKNGGMPVRMPTIEELRHDHA